MKGTDSIIDNIVTINDISWPEAELYAQFAMLTVIDTIVDIAWFALAGFAIFLLLRFDI